MTEGSLIPKIIAFTIPIILSGVLQQCFNIADNIVVGRFGAEHSVGAVGSNTSLINLLVNFFVGLGTGTGILTARAIGERNAEKASRSIHTAIPAALICGAFLTLVGIFGSRWILVNVLKTPADILDQATTYLTIYLCGSTMSLLYNVGSAILRAAGDSKRPLIYITVSGIVNVGLNLIFVIVFHLDVAGVALATIISQTLSAVLVMRELLGRNDMCKVVIKKLKIIKYDLLQILRVALPSGITSMLFHFSNVMVQSTVNTFGSTAVDGLSAATSIEAFASLFANSFNAAAQNFAAQNIGAKKKDRVVKSVLYSVLCSFVFGLVSGLTIFAFARPLLGIYLKNSAEKIEYGVIKMSYLCRTFAISGLMNTMGGGLRGMGAPIVSMIMTLIGACGLRLVWIYTVFPHYNTLQCLYTSYPLSWAVTFVAEFVAFLILLKKFNKKEGSELA